MRATRKVHLETPRLAVVLPAPSAAPDVLAFIRANREHFAPWDPPRPPGFFTEVRFWRDLLERGLDDYAEDRSLRLFLKERETGDYVGTCSFSHFARGPRQACVLGFALDHRRVGKGLMAEGLRAALAFVFDELGFHRIEANHMPENERSGRLLRRLGFQEEGLARSYLFINGAWRDHVLTALVNPRVEPPRLPWPTR